MPIFLDIKWKKSSYTNIFNKCFLKNGFKQEIFMKFQNDDIWNFCVSIEQFRRLNNEMRRITKKQSWKADQAILVYGITKSSGSKAPRALGRL